MRQIERQNDFWTKNASNIFIIQNLELFSLNSRDLFLSLIDLLKWQNFFRI